MQWDTEIKTEPERQKGGSRELEGLRTREIDR
jgi:hypothetical protein